MFAAGMLRHRDSAFSIQAEGKFAVAWQVRLSSAEERATKAERERKELVSSLERQLAAARTEILDWRRELAAAEAERDRLAADRKALAKRASLGSLYAGYGGTPKARGAHFKLGYYRYGMLVWFVAPLTHANLHASRHGAKAVHCACACASALRSYSASALRGLLLGCRRRQPARSGGRLCRAADKRGQRSHWWRRHCVPEECAAQILGFTSIRTYRAGDLTWPFATILSPCRRFACTLAAMMTYSWQQHSF